MKYRIVFNRRVWPEIREAAAWYEKSRNGLGREFCAAIREVFVRLQTMPLVHACFWQAVRRAASDRFPYSVYYRVNGDTVEVIAVTHDKRDPQLWQSRFSDN